MGTTPNHLSFLLSLQWVFLPDISSREHLALPLALQIDYRAACFCHQKLVEVGFVCSVCLSSEWASECVCVHARAQCHGIVNGFSRSILPVNSNMLHLPVSLTTVAPSCKCYRKITNSFFHVLRTHFKLATLPLKSTKPKKKRNNKLRSSVNASWFLTVCGLSSPNPILLCTVGQSHYLFMRINYTSYTEVFVSFILRSNFEKSPEDKNNVMGMC